MRRIRRLALLFTLIAAIVCVVLLLNITAPNPTRRRYSSETPPTSGNMQNIGLRAEEILSKDLGVPRNDLPDQRVCLCRDPSIPLSPQECRACLSYTQLSATHRRPDFITSRFIAESKNVEDMLYSHTDRVEQIGDYALAARTLGIPLYLYTRVNTNLAVDFYRLVESTGGAVVHYFTVPGWADPVDQVARAGLFIAAPSIALLAAWELVARRRASGPTHTIRVKPRGPRDPLGKAIDSVELTQQFGKRTEDKLKRKLD